MWNRARVRSSSLQALGQLARLSRRYKIEKIQRLSANFEKACWRSVRCAEELAYDRKYLFLRHCVNVINARRAEPREETVSFENIASSIAQEYDGKNGRYLITRIDANIERLERGLRSLMTYDFFEQRTEVRKSDLIDKCKENGLSARQSLEYVCKTKEIHRLRSLRGRLECLIGIGPDMGKGKGHSKDDLMDMALDSQKLFCTQQ